MNCPNCKSEVKPNAEYCHGCGVSLDGYKTPIFLQKGTYPGDKLVPGSINRFIRQIASIYINNFRVFLVIALVGHAPLIFSVFIQSEAMRRSLELVAVFSGFLASAASTYAVCQYYLGHQVTAAKCYVAALNSGTAILFSSLILTAAIFLSVLLSAILIGIPLMIFLVVALLLYIEAIIVEGKGSVGSLVRSWELVRGNWWWVFCIAIVLLVITSVTAWLPVLIHGFDQLNTEGPLDTLPTSLGLFVNLISACMIPIFYIGRTLIYLGLRERKEEYTREKLASDLG